MRRILYFFFTALTALSLRLSATIPVYLDYSQFRFDSVRTSVLISYAFADSVLVYRKSSQGFHAGMDFDLKILSAGEVVTTRTWSIESNLASATDPERHELVGQKEIELKPGQYTLKLRYSDANRPARSDSIQLPLVVRRFDLSRPLISDVQLCARLKVASTANSTAYSRNGWEIVPLPAKELRGESPVLYSYVELYNLHLLKSDSVSILYSITDGANRSVYDARYDRKVIAKAQTEVFEQLVEILPSGVYYETVTVLIPGANTVDSERVTKKFYILNPSLPAELPDLRSEDELFLASEFATMNEQRITEEYEKAKAVGPPQQLLSFPQLSTLNAKQKFIFRYWLLLDPDPTTPINERYEDFKKAVDYAVKNYKNSFHPRGWDCDRARVLMKYGFPSKIDREYFNWDGARPHETWAYDNIQGGAIFVFVDNNGSGNFILVHSTAINEHRDDDWYNRYATDKNRQK